MQWLGALLVVFALLVLVMYGRPPKAGEPKRAESKPPPPPLPVHHPEVVPLLADALS